MASRLDQAWSPPGRPHTVRDVHPPAEGMGAKGAAPAGAHTVACQWVYQAVVAAVPPASRRHQSGRALGAAWAGGARAGGDSTAVQRLIPGPGKCPESR